MATKKTAEEATLEDIEARLESVEDRVADIEADSAKESDALAKRLEKVEKLANDLLISIRMG